MYLYVICFAFRTSSVRSIPVDLIVRCISLWKLYVLLRPLLPLWPATCFLFDITVASMSIISVFEFIYACLCITLDPQNSRQLHSPANDQAEITNSGVIYSIRYSCILQH